MHGLGSKLSKHVLGMKFMRKTKDQLDKTHVERKHREHFASDIKPRPTSSACPKLETIVEEVPSYSQCLGYKFGRLSFGGFNPTVEYNVRKRNWRAVHVREMSSDEEDEDPGSEEDVKLKQEADVDEEEMAETYGSIIGTVGRQMMDRHEKEGKHKGRRDKWRKRDRRQGQEDREVTGESYGIDLVKKSVGGWARKGLSEKPKKKNKNSNNNNEVYAEEPSFSGNRNRNRHQNQHQGQTQSQGQKNKRDSGAQPPQKKRKFMKPSEDYD